MCLVKQYNPTKQFCNVTFKLASSYANHPKEVFLVGDFNDWDRMHTPMTVNSKGEFIASLILESGREYQYKYFRNGNSWINDIEADKYVINEFQGENSVVVV